MPYLMVHILLVTYTLCQDVTVLSRSWYHTLTWHDMSVYTAWQTLCHLSETTTSCHQSVSHSHMTQCSSDNTSDCCVLIMNVNVTHSLEHGLHTFAAVTIANSACYPPQKGKMSLSQQ